MTDVWLWIGRGTIGQGGGEHDGVGSGEGKVSAVESGGMMRMTRMTRADLDTPMPRIDMLFRA